MAFLTSSSPPVSGRYKIIAWIGAGGMQNVYSAHDLLFRRDVAIKTPKEGATLGRFEKSAIMSAKVNHINVAKTLDYVEDSGVPFLVEELVIGQDFSKFVPRVVPIMPPSACARIFHQLARGLAASHHAGVVHRDLKPSNIMAVNGSRLSGVKITDFGIAKMAEAEIGEWAGVGKGGTTSSKTVLGAIPYMAPESITDFSKGSFPADIWAIGAIVYQLLSGKFPFGEGLLSIPNILKGDVPIIPAAVSPLQFRGLGTELYEVICQCLNPDPKARIDAEGLVKAMEPLCYAVDEYELGSITKVQNSYWGFLRSDEGKNAMYHVESFFGGASPSVGQRVWFARHPGMGNDRAFPLVKVAA